MATRKQRARRAKTFRHEYALVDTDEEGNEIELRASELRAKKQDGPGKTGTKKTAAKPASRSRSSSGARPLREPPPPSWDRALKRGLLWGIIAGGAATFLLHGPIVLAAMYPVLFVPLTYWTDGYAYRRFERKKAEQSAERASPRSGKAR